MGSVIKKAVIPCAGLGTRFLPATKAQPKEMLPVFDRPAIQYIIEEALASDIEDIVLVTGRGKQAIENHFDKSFELEHYLKERKQFQLLNNVERIAELADIYYVRQKQPLGLGHAISCAKSYLQHEPFAVFLADDLIYSKTPAIKQLIDVYSKYNCSVLAVQEVPKDKISHYGVIKPVKVSGNVFKVEDIVEKPAPENAPSNLGVVGRYILVPEIFDILEKVQKGKGGEIQLTDAIKLLLKTKPVYAVKFSGKRYDTGDKLGYMKASIEYALRDKEIGSKLKGYLKTL
ncbi:MAG: UTP--glucose-1-phosphate uridylyltransferase [Candidatus Firestonebacteria bacterium RIFOXYA2_FULL_40_8]|nr:MAG: UTP--glucose-1-phosphate uridylyltransferase [Candidatus Firestonebacteria bacterium RIFOXYA2_FULL_40_8]